MPSRGERGERRTHQQCLRARVGSVIDARRIGAGVEEDCHQRGRAEREPDQNRGEHLRARAHEAHQDQQRDRPQQVPLLFDRERPRVGEGRRRLERLEVRRAVEDEPPVGYVEQRREAVTADRPELGRLRPHDGVDRDPDQQEEERREQAAGASRPEGLEIDPAGVLALGQQERGDEVAAQDEEHVDAEEAALRPGDLPVVQDHRRDRERAQAVEPGPVAEAGSLSGGSRHGLQGNERPIGLRGGRNGRSRSRSR